MGSDERTGSGVTTTTTPTPETTPTTNGAATTAKPAATRPPKQGGAQKATATNTPTSNPAFRKRAERRPEMIAKRREERYKQYEQRKKQWLWTKIGLGAVAVLIVGALAWAGVIWVQDRIDAQALDDVVSYDYDGGGHTATPDEPVTYAEVPPVGGTHDNAWQNCGYYAVPIDNWHGVHSLEHGAVWITYRPDLPADQIAELKELADGTSYILVSPYPDLPAPVVMSAWNHQLVLDSVNGDGFDAFIREYRRSPDNAPEPNGVCTGGTSETA